MSRKAGPHVSIIVPTFREAENLRELCASVDCAMRAAGLAYDLALVDDASGDGSDGIVAEIAAAGRPVKMIVRTTERGLSSAVIHGFRAASGDVLVCMDADLSHPPDRIAQLVDAVWTGSADLALGSRYVMGGSTDENWGVGRWLNSKVATLLARPFTRASDPMSGFFAIRRDRFALAADLSPVGYKIGLEVIVKCRCRRVAEVPIHFADRRHGTSKLSIRERINYLRHVKRLADYQFGVGARVVLAALAGVAGMLAGAAAWGFGAGPVWLVLVGFGGAAVGWLSARPSRPSAP